MHHTPGQQLKPSELMHPNGHVCVQLAPSKPCILLPSKLRELTGCTARRFGVWELAMYHIDIRGTLPGLFVKVRTSLAKCAVSQRSNRAVVTQCAQPACECQL